MIPSQPTEAELLQDILALETQARELQTPLTCLKNQITIIPPIVGNLSTFELIENARTIAVEAQTIALKKQRLWL